MVQNLEVTNKDQQLLNIISKNSLVQTSNNNNESKKLTKRKRIQSKIMITCNVDDCDREYKTTHNLIRHKNMLHIKKKFQCDIGDCNFKCTTLNKLDIHKCSHTLIYCDFQNCEYKSSNQYYLKNHKKVHTKEKPFKCDVEACNYKCSQSTRLTTHKRIHTFEKPYQCDFKNCNYKCSQSSHLMTHEKIHSGFKPFKCDFGDCSYKSSQSSHLNSHKKTHTNEKPFKCNVNGCNYKSSTSSNLITHARTHNGEKPFHCNYDGCNYRSSVSSNLIRHSCMHNGEKPFFCDFIDCDYKSITSGELTSHKKIHTGEKNFHCTVNGCNFKCARSNGLAAHKRSHTSEKPFRCDHCGSKFAKNGSLKSHVNMHERQSHFKYACEMQDYGFQKCSKSDVCCTVRCATLRHMDYHIQRNHTQEGISAKFESETKLAAFLALNEISFDRDWLNIIQFSNCKNIEGRKSCARPDFYLHAKSAQLKAIVIICNDEFAHRQYKCDFQRIWNIVHALQQTIDFKDVPIIFIRLNPHFYTIGGKFFDPPLTHVHQKLLQTIQCLSETDIKHGVNLIYINYSQLLTGELCIFEEDASEPNDYAKLYKPCVIKIV